MITCCRWTRSTLTGGRSGAIMATASQSASCAMGLAEKILTALNLEELWPPVFMATANCADAAAARLIGLPYEVWSGLLFAGLAALGLWVFGKR